MDKLLRLLKSYYHVILFFILEVFALILVVKYNPYQKNSIIGTSNGIVGSVLSKKEKASSYFDLIEQNKRLVIENTKLLNEYKNYSLLDSSNSIEIVDSSKEHLYSYIACKVIENTIGKKKNYITLDIGKNTGVKIGMGVLGPKGVVGKIIRVNTNFSLAMSMLNTQFKIVPKIENTIQFSELSWEGNSPEWVTINRISNIDDYSKGDKVYTGPYSPIFPEDLSIGHILNIQKAPNSEFYEIQVALAENFKNLREVHVIINNYKSQLDDIKNEQP